MDKMNKEVCVYAPMRHKRKTVRWDPGTNFDTRGIAISHRKRAQMKAGEDCQAGGKSTKLAFITLRRTKALNLRQFVFPPAEAMDFEQFGDFDSSPDPLLPTLENAQEALNNAVKDATQAVHATQQDAPQDAPQNSEQDAQISAHAVQTLAQETPSL